MAIFGHFNTNTSLWDVNSVINISSQILTNNKKNKAIWVPLSDPSTWSKTVIQNCIHKNLETCSIYTFHKPINPFSCKLEDGKVFLDKLPLKSIIRLFYIQFYSHVPFFFLFRKRIKDLVSHKDIIMNITALKGCTL